MIMCFGKPSASTGTLPVWTSSTLTGSAWYGSLLVTRWRYSLDGTSGESEQFPAHFVAVAAVQRIGEIPFVGVAPQQIEEEFRRQRRQRDLVLLQLLEHVQLPVTGKLRERPVERGLAVLVDLANRDAVDFLWREARLVALLRGALEPRAAAIHAAVRAPGAGQLAVDVDDHAGIPRPGAQLIGGNQMLDGGFEKANLGLQQIQIGSRDRVVAQGRLLVSPLRGV